MSTLGALVAMAAEHGGAATPYSVQHLDMRPVQPAATFFDEAALCLPRSSRTPLLPTDLHTPSSPLRQC
jgi:hypothetical protein